MIDETVGKIEAKIQSADAIKDERKRELLELLGRQPFTEVRPKRPQPVIQQDPPELIFKRLWAVQQLSRANIPLCFRAQANVFKDSRVQVMRLPCFHDFGSNGQLQIRR